MDQPRMNSAIGSIIRNVHQHLPKPKGFASQHPDAPEAPPKSGIPLTNRRFRTLDSAAEMLTLMRVKPTTSKIHPVQIRIAPVIVVTAYILRLNRPLMNPSSPNAFGHTSIEAGTLNFCPLASGAYRLRDQADPSRSEYHPTRLLSSSLFNRLLTEADRSSRATPDQIHSASRPARLSRVSGGGNLLKLHLGCGPGGRA